MCLNTTVIRLQNGNGQNRTDVLRLIDMVSKPFSRAHYHYGTLPKLIQTTTGVRRLELLPTRLICRVHQPASRTLYIKLHSIEKTEGREASRSLNFKLV
ncbi:hypothetical protein LCGC14_2203770 [marine sediment metagenome]|uniref:Uncharacterized protein n=1 Tax=marine sediment metagenome TaxID=412755 RepID=A0A0F9DFV0_9ZZZZ